MAFFKCKMCGGTLDINGNETVATCEYCGTQQTLPKLDDDRKVNLYDRANHFRRNNEFDKAMGIYEQILNDDNTDAEAYWSLVLCRYGIEYVEDPSSHKRIPTVNRAQFTSIFDDDNYKSALKYADNYQCSIYKKEAKAINEIQKGILAISQKEEPFDVFICYKETDNNGRRTPDSVLANDLYHQLTQEGFKVFFARITLEDKLGSAYEPYIFAALNSAKVMVVLGTKPEYFNAVWVKNEWSRYLSLIKQGQKKTLIPAYKDMDPYDLPEEFSHLQAQDMSKLGFMQDLIRGIKKIVETKTSKDTIVKETVLVNGNTNTEPLLKRVYMFLEDGDWASADEYCEKVLDIDPENGYAYLGKLMSELRVRKQELLKDCDKPFDHIGSYQKAIRFGDEKLKTELDSYIKHINTRNEIARFESIYTHAINTMSKADDAVSKANFGEDIKMLYREAEELFKSISEYRDSYVLAQSCNEKAENVSKDYILCDGKTKMRRDTISHYQSAIKLFESISGWKDADEMILECQKKIKIALEEKEKRAKRIKKNSIIASFIICVVFVFVIVLNGVIIPWGKYIIASKLMDAGNIDEAYNTFVEIGNFADSAEKAGDIRYEKIKEKLKNIEVGSYINFGVYDREEIEWLVLDIKDGKALVISKNALDKKMYNEESIDVTWETCTLRKWLNDDFLNIAFSTNERTLIPTVTVPTDKNPKYNTDTGEETLDQVFLLSVNEVNKYFGSDSAKICSYDEEACFWWLRTPGYHQNRAVSVSYTGDVIEEGNYVDHDYRAVRPALWINLNS